MRNAVSVLTVKKRKDIHRLALVILRKISERTGTPIEKLKKELKRRSELLGKLAKEGAPTFEAFTHIVNEYHKDPEAIIKRYKLK